MNKQVSRRSFIKTNAKGGFCQGFQFFAGRFQMGCMRPPHHDIAAKYAVLNERVGAE